MIDTFQCLDFNFFVSYLSDLGLFVIEKALRWQSIKRFITFLGHLLPFWGIHEK
jgi:hypothetical protein